MIALPAWLTWQEIVSIAGAIAFSTVFTWVYGRRRAGKMAQPGPEANPLIRLANAISPLVSGVSAIPLPQLTLAGAILAFSYNLGYFRAIGLIFMSLFSIQEHIVFALSGLVEITVLLIAISIIFNLYTLLPKHDNYPLWLVILLTISAGYIAITATLQQLTTTYSDAGAATTWSKAFALMCGILLFFALRQPTIRENLTFIFLLLVGSSLALGVWRGNELVHSREQHAWNVAVTRAGERFGIVRVGADYTIVVSPDLKVTAVKTGIFRQFGPCTKAPDIRVSPRSTGLTYT